MAVLQKGVLQGKLPGMKDVSTSVCAALGFLWPALLYHILQSFNWCLL